MKVRVILTIDFDAADWTLAFGTDPAKIRQDVRDYVTENVRHCGVFGDGEVPATVTQA